MDHQSLNRISLSLARHERILQSLRTSYATSTTTTSTTTTSSATAPPLSGGFSSLTRPTLTPRAADDGNDSERHRRLTTEGRALPPEAGLGYVASPKEAEARTSDGKLRERLLGRRGPLKGGEGESRAKRRRGAESESDEEEGRSGLGRGKRRAGDPFGGGAAGREDGDGLVGGVGAVAGDERRVGETAGGGTSVDMEEAVVSPVRWGVEAGVVEPDAEDTNSKKGREMKEKMKKKKNKKNKGKGKISHERS